jgi:hypothetical protein
MKVAVIRQDSTVQEYMAMSISSISSQNPYALNYAPKSASTTIKAKAETTTAETAMVADAPTVMNTAKLSGNVNSIIMSKFRQSFEDSFNPNKQNLPETQANKALGEFMGNLMRISFVNVADAMKNGNDVYVQDMGAKLQEVSQAIRSETTAVTSSSETTASTMGTGNSTTPTPYAAIEQSYKNLVSSLGGTYNKAELNNFLDSFGSSFSFSTPKGNMVNASA